MRTYDYVFITHLPAFYKVNLYQALGQHCKIFVIFIADGSIIRAKDFTPQNFGFDHHILHHGDFEHRNRWQSMRQLWLIVRKLRFHQLVLGGWDLPEFWFLAFCFPKKVNALALESSVFESRVQGWRFTLKRLFLSRIQTVFYSGEPHHALLRHLHYKGISRKTGGVGIFNYTQKQTLSRDFKGRFLFVGRLAPEKNLMLLLSTFASLPQFNLTLVGHGPLSNEIKEHKPSNVKLLGHVAPQDLAQIYQTHDVLILPSLKEPWGLVIEEALYYGLPVIASDKVGCGHDIILKWQVGTLFSCDDKAALTAAILWVREHYAQLIQKISTLDFKARDSLQVQQYLEALL